MKLNKEVAPFETNIEKDSKDSFELHDQGLIMSLIRDKMYSKKLYTPIQEIISNARDAVRELHASKLDKNSSDFQMKEMVEDLYAKNPHVEITLPNDMNPMLIVRDFGVGISKERIELIKRVGLSTKDKSNLESGGFGLGLKSVFAYTEQFFIVSYLDGTEYVYSAQITTNIMGDLVFIGSMPTSEKNGVAIKIPIQKKDFYATNDAVAAITNFWKVKPILKGAALSSSNNLNNKEVFCHYSSGSIWKRDNHIVLIDGIPYPLDLSLYEFKDSDTKVKKIRDYLQNSVSIILYFDVGELDLVMTRENLEASEKNIIKISNKIQELIKSIIDEEQKIYSQSKQNLIDFIDYLDKGSFLKLELIHGSDYKKLDFQYEDICIKSTDHQFSIFDKDNNPIVMDWMTTTYQKGKGNKKIAIMHRISCFSYASKESRYSSFNENFNYKTAYVVEENPFVLVNAKQGESLYNCNGYILGKSDIISIPKKERENPAYISSIKFFKEVIGYKDYSVKYPSKINEYHSFKLITLDDRCRVIVEKKDLIVVKNSKKKKKMQYRVSSSYVFENIAQEIIDKYKESALKLSTLFSTLSNANVEVIESDDENVSLFTMKVFEDLLGGELDTSHLNMKEAEIYYMKIKLKFLMAFQSVLESFVMNKELVEGNSIGINILKDFLNIEYQPELFLYSDRYGSKKPSPTEIRNIKYYSDLFENKTIDIQVKSKVLNAVALDEFLEKNPLISEVYIYSYSYQKDKYNIKLKNIVDYINALWVKND